MKGVRALWKRGIQVNELGVGIQGGMNWLNDRRTVVKSEQDAEERRGIRWTGDKFCTSAGRRGSPLSAARNWGGVVESGLDGKARRRQVMSRRRKVGEEGLEWEFEGISREEGRERAGNRDGERG